MSIEDKYKKLSDVEHVIQRPSMYIGSTTDATQTSWVFNEATQKMEHNDICYNPGFIKIVDEIISNSVDESKRPDSHLNTIKIDINRSTGEITSWDNGGIPVVMHKGENQYVPEMIFGELRAGSNFNDDEDERTWVGTNGVGSTITNIFSTTFKVETADGKKKFVQTYTKNSTVKTKPSIKPIKQNYTQITFMPDYEKLNTTLHAGNYSQLVKRVYDIAGCNPNLKVYLNGELIKIKSFKDYVSMFTDDFCYDENDTWKVAIGAADGAFQQISFVNGGETSDANGSHINYILWQLIDKIRVHIKKKNKVDVKPSTIKNHLAVYIDATVINPVYSSQTKEKLITDSSKFGTSFIVSDKLIRSIIKSEVIQKILDWVLAKELANEQAELRKNNKNLSKMNPRKIVKLSDANEKKQREKCMLFLAEGDCLHEDTNIIVANSNGIADTAIKDVKVGDKVLSHDNTFNSIVDIIKKVKKTVTVKTKYGAVIMSEEHRLLVYSNESDKYQYIKAMDLDKDNHRLVKNTLADVTVLCPIISKTNIEDKLYNINITWEMPDGTSSGENCTSGHTYLVFCSSTESFIKKTANDILVDTDFMVMSDK